MMLQYASQITHTVVLHSEYVTSSAIIEKNYLRGSITSATAYGLTYPYLRLSNNVTVITPKLSTECVGFTLLRLLFQQLDSRRLVARYIKLFTGPNG